MREIGFPAVGGGDRTRIAGVRSDCFKLRGPYPEIVLATHVRRLRRALHNEQVIGEHARTMLADVADEQVGRLRSSIDALWRNHERFSGLLDQFARIVELPDAVLIEQALREGA